MRVGIAGPLLGGHPGWVVSQGERLAGHLADDGVEVLTTSERIGRGARAADTVRSVRRWRGRVDVIVVMVFSGPAFAMADLTTRASGPRGAPLVLWLHGGNLPRFAGRHPRWTSAVLRRADLVVAPSAYLAGLFPLAEGRGGRAARTAVLPNTIGVAGPRPHPRRTRPRLLWMRTFHPLYHPERAVEALATLLPRVPDATLTMAGQDRGGREAVVELAERLGIREAIRFPGFLDEAAKRRAFAEHDVFLNTSVVDNAPVSLLEAAAHGLAIVSTPTGGIPELFAPDEAALYADSPEGLAEQVLQLLADPELAHRLTSAAYGRALPSTWERVGPRWHALLAEVADRG